MTANRSADPDAFALRANDAQLSAAAKLAAALEQNDTEPCPPPVMSVVQCAACGSVGAHAYDCADFPGDFADLELDDDSWKEGA